MELVELIALAVIIIGTWSIYYYYDKEENDWEMKAKLISIGIGILGAIALLVYRFVVLFAH